MPHPAVQPATMRMIDAIQSLHFCLEVALHITLFSISFLENTSTRRTECQINRNVGTLAILCDIYLRATGGNRCILRTMLAVPKRHIYSLNLHIIDNSIGCNEEKMRKGRPWFARLRGSNTSIVCSDLSGGVQLPCKLYRARFRLDRNQILQVNSKYSFESSRQDLHNTLLCTALKSNLLPKNVRFAQLTASTPASAKPMYLSQRRPHSQMSEGLGKGGAPTRTQCAGPILSCTPKRSARKEPKPRKSARQKVLIH